MEGAEDNLTSGQSEAESDESVALTSIIVVTSVFTLFTTILVAVVIYQKWEERLKQRREGLQEKSLNVPTKVKISKKKIYFFFSKPL